MTFDDPRVIKASFLKLPVHITGKHESTLRHAGGNLFQYAEAGMGAGISV
jgi:hypothetical protein